MMVALVVVWCSILVLGFLQGVFLAKTDQWRASPLFAVVFYTISVLMPYLMARHFILVSHQTGDWKQRKLRLAIVLWSALVLLLAGRLWSYSCTH